MTKLGIEHETMSADEAEVRFPAIDLHRFGPPAPLDDLDAPFWGEPESKVEEVLVMPLGGYISDPQLAAQNLADAAKARGATFLFHREVTAVLRTSAGGGSADPGGRERVAGVVLADGTELRAPIVVNVAGPHSPVINEMAGVLDDMNISTRPMKREVFVVPAPKAVDFEAAITAKS